MNHVTRREALAAVVGTAAAALPGCTPTADTAAERREVQTMSKPSARAPVAYIPHGGGPWPFVDLGLGDRTELDELAAYLRSIAGLAGAHPKAVLAVSAHWEEAVPTVMTSERPPLLFDYYGFPPESYKLTWPAPGEPKLAARVRGLLREAGIPSGEDAQRGFDHGTFVPLKLTFPDADVPTLQLSLKKGLDPAEHIAIVRALAPLRDEGVLIVGSGMSYHNLRAFGPEGRAPSEAFNAWLTDAAKAEPNERDRLLTQWAAAPSARRVHPREEHLLPLMVVAGAAGADRGRTGYSGTLRGLRISGYHFG
jgi:aromatic ring-opening dioxygenase catalytic subunit (LigB family)